MEQLAERLLEGRTRALARAITLVESGAGAAGLLRRVYAHTGRATTVGVTGFPGAGKSSLVDRLIESFRAQGMSVGVVAVDPSSAFSGGAILGDRVRMMRHAADEGVFIRSLATRGHLGGLARTTGDAIDLMDAAGRDMVLIETVGVGQDEIEVASLADAVLVVLVPGMGDDIQAIKAGILEIADLFVINKADRQGADRLVSELRQMLSLAENRHEHPPILKTVATRAEGIGELVEAVTTHLARPETGQQRFERQRRRAEARLGDLLARRLVEQTVEQGIGADGWRKLVDQLARRDIDPYAAVETIV
ncbi:MAG: methylmalonyl Co-A mutase-associated GTPase MeaB, partial [Acidobacteriota bacterium]